MLETKQLYKIYKPKKGVPVKAIDDVSLKFGDTGMVFLLGKSGSGKSTLLNLLGGLDKYDAGEIIIKGVSSKTFSQKHFDSYRNTYVGFIFQEYNVLEDFTVGANIALALELQNRKATDEEINKILDAVDLTGYGNRKPNELSGGQKQRVAIARALVKSPKIIMADEPTGALDSNTGKQVFDTLKKLSKEKLVIVVSHDRDFASRYADRIIELSDGKVISDMTLCENLQEETAQGIVFDGAVAKISVGYHLTEDDRKAINDYIDSLNSDMKIELGAEKAKSGRFVPTDTDNIKKTDFSEFKLIKSKLSLKNSFKIGASGLKYKKFRLVVTVFLSCIAFGLFGLADTFGSYNHIETCTNSIYDTGVTYASLNKSVKITNGNNIYYSGWGNFLSSDEIKKMSKDTGVELSGVWAEDGMDMSLDTQFNGEVERTKSEYDIYLTCFCGFTEMDAERAKKLQYKLLGGSYPNGSENEIAISDYACKIFIKCGYFDGKTYEKKDGADVPVYQKITKSTDMIGKTLMIDGTDYKITGIVDTLLDFDRYKGLADDKIGQSSADNLKDYVLFNEYQSAVTYSYSGMAMVGSGFIESRIEKLPRVVSTNRNNLHFSDAAYEKNLYCSYVSNMKNIKDTKIRWLDGERKTLGEKEIIVTSDLLMDFTEKDVIDLDEVKAAKLIAYISDINYTETTDIDGFKIVGVINNTSENPNMSMTIVLPENLYDKYFKEYEGDYRYALGAMPKTKAEIKDFAEYCYDESRAYKYEINNAALFELDAANEVFKELSKYFFYIGLGFALFAAIMLANFIATSISHKKQEIGILRAIGSRSNDVFRIFFSESFIIAMINFVLSSIGVAVATYIINYELRITAGLLVTVLSFGVRQVVLLLAVSILVAFLASFFPVKRIASKRPIDAIRNR